MREVNWLRLGRDAFLVFGVLAAVAMWWLYTFGGLGQPVDVHYYWAADPANLYPHPELAEHNGYNYSPAFEFVVFWGRGLSFEVFTAIWRGLLLVALVYLAGPLTLPVLLLVPVASEVNAGNIQLLLAAAVVIGFRHPAAWAFVLLTKVTPGVGLLWFAVRREWRPLVIVAAATGVLALVSLIANSHSMAEVPRAHHERAGSGRCAVLPATVGQAAAGHSDRRHRGTPGLAVDRCRRGDAGVASVLHHQLVDARWGPAVRSRSVWSLGRGARLVIRTRCPSGSHDTDTDTRPVGSASDHVAGGDDDPRP